MKNSISTSKRWNPIAPYYRKLMQRQGLSTKQLAQASGVSELKIRELLTEHIELNEKAFHPLILKATSAALGVDPIYIFQLAGYLDLNEALFNLDDEEFYFAQRFRHLPHDKRQILWEALEATERISNISTPSGHISTLLYEVNHLRCSHPMFIKRRFKFRPAAELMPDDLTQTAFSDLLLNKVETCLQHIFGDTAPETSRLMTVINHSSTTIILNALLPRNEIPSNLEKMFWLFQLLPLDKTEGPTSTEYKTGIKALWSLLDRVTL